MPGFGLFFDTSGNADKADDRLDCALAAMQYDSRYRTGSVMAGPSLRVGWAAYDGYPIQIWQSETAVLFAEGMVYDRGWDDLLPLLQSDCANRPEWKRAVQFLRDWVAKADGDFAIVFAAKIPPYRAIVGLDALGRLPVYWCRDGQRLLVSREVKFITSLLSTVQPDRAGIAQTLAMGFPWEEKTLIAGVHRLPPGAVLSWHEESGDGPELQTYKWAFDPSPVQGDMPSFAGELVDQFVMATRLRVQACSGRPLVLSLSGGMDSRAVAASLHRLHAEARARTFSLPGYQPPREIDSARSIAALCGLPWRVVPLSPPSLTAYDRLIRLKDGLNSAAMAYADEYLSALVRDSGPEAVLFSGGGGDLALVPRHPERSLRSTRELADLLLSRNLTFHPDLLADAMGVNRDELRDELTAILETYPETDMAGKYLHFCFMGYEFKSYFEGEDRNRAYLWTEAPFYARPFFERAMRSPFAWKRRRLLNREFLRQLSLEVARVRNANTGLIPGSLRDRTRQWLREVVLSHASWERAVRNRRRRTRRGGTLPLPVQDQLLATTKSSPLVGEVFHRDRLLAWAQNPHHPPQAWPLYTVVRYLDMCR
jgi:asparagine synthase (glutamine-hydrolysing)